MKLDLTYYIAFISGWFDPVELRIEHRKIQDKAIKNKPKTFTINLELLE